ncbi:hypothetical protein ACP70R_006914 [Stipagrostis hirtigluma subsp. patula]
MGALLHDRALEPAAAELQLQLAVLTFVGLATAVALFRRAIPSLNLLGARRPAGGEGEPETALRSTATAAEAPAGSSSRSPLPPFTALCLAMGTLLHAEPLVCAASELRLHPGVVACAALSIAALFHWAILSINIFVARWAAEKEPKILLRPTATAAAAPTGSRPHFMVLCLAMGVLMHAEKLVAAAADTLLHPCVLPCFVLFAAALFNWAIISLNIIVARRPPEREPNILLRRPPVPAASTVHSSHLARAAFLVLAALMSASWFVEHLMAAAADELRLPWIVLVVTLVFFAALFNASIHLFRSFFLPRPPLAAAAAQREGAYAVTAATVGMGIAACFVAIGGSSYVVRVRASS